MASFTHIDEEGRVRMVDVTEKAVTQRTATARGRIFMQAETLSMIVNRQVKKGNVLETARIAGVMAAKKTADLIPMCHPLAMTHIAVDFFPDPNTNSIEIRAEAKVEARTGVEMEALTAVSVAALTIYDMCKSHDRAMAISDICLLEKTGGKSGTFGYTLVSDEK
jgi:cyclic pyranopterin monophosphate synthase